ncbi:MAG: 50S ribosomal protein L6 [Planctomycetota bacterium]
MSRIGKQPVAIPSGIDVTVKGGEVTVKGKNGQLSQSFDTRHVAIEVKDGAVEVTRKSDLKQARAMHGLYRALIQNMIVGCSNGFRRELEIEGVGYQAKAAGNTLTLQIGFCHPVEIPMPDGVTCETPANTKIVLSGPDKQAIGQIAANIRGVRPPEPYKGKGIRYAGEHIRRKAGKSVSGK